MKALGKRFFRLPILTKLEILLYPIFLLWRMPIAWLQGIWKAKVLLGGKWSNFMGFHPVNSLNNLFYRTQWINIRNYGRGGISPLLGLGDYPLSNWFHLSSFSSFCYANAAPVVTLLGTLFWCFSFLPWLITVEPKWCILVSFALLLSSSSYAMAFARQNYQIIGWMWLPVALFGLSNQNWELASIAWLGGGLGGLTQIFFAVPIVLLYAVQENSFLPLITILPALLLVLLRFLPLIKQGNLKKSLIQISKLIGFTSREVRYRREIQSLSLNSIYYLLLYSLASLLFYLETSKVPYLALLGILIFLFNQRLFRVADHESLIVIFLSLFATEVLVVGPNWVTLFSLWLAACSYGFFLSVQDFSEEGQLSGIRVYEPFDHQELLNQISNFFSPVPEGSTVYFAFSDPDGSYGKIFDGYRHIHEVPLHVATLRKINLFPDWWAVSQTNYVEAPNCWGRTKNEVLENLLRWKTKYVVVYQEGSSSLDSNWKEDFKELASFDWRDFVPIFKNTKPWSPNLLPPKWFLLKYQA